MLRDREFNALSMISTGGKIIKHLDALGESSARAEAEATHDQVSTTAGIGAYNAAAVVLRCRVTSVVTVLGAESGPAAQYQKIKKAGPSIFEARAEVKNLEDFSRRSSHELQLLLRDWVQQGRALRNASYGGRQPTGFLRGPATAAINRHCENMKHIAKAPTAPYGGEAAPTAVTAAPVAPGEGSVGAVFAPVSSWSRMERG
jgi:hypothetical protein